MSAALGVVDLPWPSRTLHPNSRPHWSAKARAVKRARIDAGWLAVEAGLTTMQAAAIKATITFSPPDNRARDTDGMLSSMKPAIDGIADVVGVDDSKWQFELVRGAPRKGGNVRIVLEVVPS